MMNVDLNELCNNLSDEKIIELVTSLGSDEYIDKNDCIIFKTICHNEAAEDGSMKLYYYKKNKKFHCYTDCGCNFNIINLFQKRYELLDKDYNFYKDIILKIDDNESFNQLSKNSFYNKYESIYDKYKIENPTVELPKYNKSILNIFNFYPIREWLNDGITEEAMKFYDIKYSINQNKIIIPHFDINNNLIGIRGRALNEEDIEIGKYMPLKIENTIYAHPLMYNLYGLNKVKENIAKYKMAIIAEGEKSPLQYYSMFGEAADICVANCGSTIHRYQINLLRQCGAERILIAYDKEGQTWKEKQKYYDKLKNICYKYKNLCQMGFIFDTSDYLSLKDSPFDKGKEIFKKLLKQGVWI